MPREIEKHLALLGFFFGWLVGFFGFGLFFWGGGGMGGDAVVVCFFLRSRLGFKKRTC